jgi:ferredoxin
MSLKITNDCTACDSCRMACPHEAITAGDIIYLIDPDRCTECVGTFSEPQCREVCPVDCILPGVKESIETLVARNSRLQEIP